MKTYAGIGSRQTPDDVLADMEFIAERLAILGWRLRSGHAPGADQAFETGAGDNAECYLPWPYFEREVPVQAKHVFQVPTDEAEELAKRHHPGWYYLKRPARRLMARNSHQVLGYDLRTPIRFLICWTVGARGEGGTGQAIRIAHAHQIPVYDLARPDVRHNIVERLSFE